MKPIKPGDKVLCMNPSMEEYGRVFTVEVVGSFSNSDKMLLAIGTESVGSVFYTKDFSKIAPNKPGEFL